MTDCERFDEIKTRLLNRDITLSDEEINFLNAHECQNPDHDPDHKAATYADLMRDPRTTSLAHGLTVRLRRGLIRVGRKLPAHEVILDMLEDCVEELEEHPKDERRHTDMRDATRAATLCMVMSNMVIPDKHRAATHDYLCRLRARCMRWENSPSMSSLDSALRALLQKLEDEDAAKAAQSAKESG